MPAAWPVGTTRRALVQRAYAATAQGVGAFGPLVTAVIEARNGFAAADQEVFGDGARVDLAARGRDAAGGHAGSGPMAPDRGPAASPARGAARQGGAGAVERAGGGRLERGDVAGAVAVLAEVARIAPHRR